MPVSKRDYLPDVKRNLKTAKQKLLLAGNAAGMKKRKVMLRAAQQAFQRGLTLARQLPFSGQADKIKKECERGFANSKHQLNYLMQQERREREAAALIHKNSEAGPADADADASPDDPAPEAPEAGDRTEDPAS